MQHIDDEREPEQDDAIDTHTDADGATDATDAPTTEVPAASAAPQPPPATGTPVTDTSRAASSPRAALDGRTIGIVATGVVLLVVAFLAGMATGGDDRADGRGEFVMQRDGGLGMGAQGRPGARGDGGHEGRGGPGFGGRGERGGMSRGFGGRGERGGMDRRHMGGGPSRGGGLGVVEDVSDGELAIDPLRGGEDATIIAVIDDDTRLVTRGDAGPRDAEEIDLSDIDEGDIVMVHGTPSDEDGDEDEDDDGERRIDAKVIVLLRAGE